MSHDKTLILLAVTVLAAFGLSACHDEYDLPDVIPTTGMEVSPFTRAAQEDGLTIKDFRRSYGVGFSYDGIWGQPCNLRDVHSRVLDMEKVQACSDEISEQLFSTFSTNEVTIKCTTALSHSEYKQRTSFYADVEAELLVFNGNYQANIEIWEEGHTNEFFCDVSYVAPSMRMELQDASTSILVKEEDRTDILTPNFRDAVAWLDKHHDAATIDSFLVCYGSHVVTSATVGGSVDIHMTMQRDSLIDIYSNQQLGAATVASILTSVTEKEEYKKELNLLNSADCSVTVKGGDLSTIPNELMHFRFGERPDLSKYVRQWQASLNYDSNDYTHNNLEMTDMEVVPIWNFIANEEVARLVKLRVEGTAEELVSENGYQNFTNTSFKLPQSVTCKMGGQSKTFDQPAIANVLASGRYVATICREQIDLPDVGKKEVQVVYPIYNQQVNLSCGYTTYDDAAYFVRWIGEKCKVEKDTVCTPSPDGTIYMTYGVPGSVKFANIKYQACHTVIGYEWPMSIKKDGSLDISKPYFLTYKRDTDFLLRNTNGQEQSGKLDGLPNWTQINGRMVRDKKYYYYWNPNEVQF